MQTRRALRSPGLLGCLALCAGLPRAGALPSGLLQLHRVLAPEGARQQQPWGASPGAVAQDAPDQAGDAGDAVADANATQSKVYVSPPNGTEQVAWKVHEGHADSPKPRWKLLLLFLAIVVVPCALVGGYSGRAASPAARPAAVGPADEAAARAEARDPAARQRAFAADRTRLKSAVFVAALCHFCMSYNTGIIAGALLYIQVDPNFAPLDSWSVGAIVSFMLVGAAVGAACGSVADWIGRKVTLLGVALMYVMGGFMMCTASTVEVLAAGRAVAGLGVGVSSGLVNLYITEVAPPDARSQLNSWAPLMGTFGLVASFAASTLLCALPLGAWRLQLALGMVPAVLVLLLGRLLPESPRWLLVRGRRDDAQAALAALFPAVSPQALAAEVAQLQEELGAETAPSERLGFYALCTKHGRAFAYGIAINVLQQATGINVVIYYGPTLLKLVGFSNLAALLTTLAISVGQFFTVLANVAALDAIGRRPVAIAGILVIMVGIGLVITGFLCRSLGALDVLMPPWIVVAGMFLFRAAFSFSLSPLPYVTTAELFPQEARGVGLALTCMANWIANFVVCQFFPVAEDWLTAYVSNEVATAIIFGAYLVCTSLALCFVVAFLPERPASRSEGPAGGGLKG